jgi:hypothetical protein
MEDAMVVDTGQSESDADTNGYHSIQEESSVVSDVTASAINGYTGGNGQISRNGHISRPSRESVLKRLSEALLRHSLTKVSHMTCVCHVLSLILIFQSNLVSPYRLICRNEDFGPLMHVWSRWLSFRIVIFPY